MTAVADDERERIREELKEMFEGLTLSRRQEINKADSCFGKPSVALVVQGSKCAVIGEREYRYAEGQYCRGGFAERVPERFAHEMS